MKRIPIKVTDHAALRYLQRVKGIDTDAIKAEVEAIVDAASDHAGCSAIVSDGFRYAIRQGCVTTITRVNVPTIRTAGRVKDHPE